MRDIVRDPETGQPALVKVSYEVIELGHFQQVFQSVAEAHDTLLAQKKTLDEQIKASESRLEEAKSELDLARRVVADIEPGSDLDEGEDGTSSEVEVAAQRQEV